MKRRVTFSITTAAILILSFAQHLSAQDGRQFVNRLSGSKESAQRSAVTLNTPKQKREELIALYVEAEATFRYLSGYAIGLTSFQKNGYGDVSSLLEDIVTSRKLIETMPDNYVEVMYGSFRDPKAVKRLANGLRKVREDVNFQAALDRSEKWFSAESARISRGEDANSDVRSAPSAPSFTDPVCHFNDLNFYPSAADVGIAKGVAFAAEIVTLLIPPTIDVPILGFKIPSPARAIAAIAWGVLEALVIGFENARDDGTYCQGLAINIQSALTTDGTFNASIILPKDAGGFANLLKEYVAAAIQNAKNKSIQVNCADTKLAEADGFYSQGKWSDAYKKYRSAYQNINANACVP